MVGINVIMKQNSNRRSRPRGSNKRSHGRNSYDSNGPAGRVRGTAQQVLEKYQVLGRDAASSGDWIAAESCLQFAEHYFRIVNSESESNGKLQAASVQESSALSEVDAKIGESITQEIQLTDKGQDITNSLEPVIPDKMDDSGNAVVQTEEQDTPNGVSENRGGRRRRSRVKSENQTSSVSGVTEV